MKSIVFCSAIPSEVDNLNEYLTVRMTRMMNNMGVDYVEWLQMEVQMKDGEEMIVKPSWLSPAGWTGFGYGTEKDWADGVSEDTLIEEPAQMAAILAQIIKSHGGFDMIQITGDVEDKEAEIVHEF